MGFLWLYYCERVQRLRNCSVKVLKTLSAFQVDSEQTFCKGHITLHFDACERRAALRADALPLNVNIPTWMVLRQSALCLLHSRRIKICSLLSLCYL